jgi:predicted ATPase/class 3 adenylate cyclase
MAMTRMPEVVARPSRDGSARVENAPAEVVTFLLTDIEGSSLRWLNHRAAMQEALREHDRILRDAVALHRGRVFKTTGDGMYAAFQLPADAVNASVTAQQLLINADWRTVEGLAVRMAIHVGTAQRRSGDYFGPALNRAARLLSLAHGGQILATAALVQMVESERDSAHRFTLLGTPPLDDPLQPIDVHQVEAIGLRRDFPPLRVANAHPTNLPRQLAPLIGRDKDRARLLALLDAHPLVTVTGSGGVGKTRIAVDVAAEHMAAFAQGAWLIELAAISDGASVPAAIASALEIRLLPGQSNAKGLARRLGTYDVLLVIDNCEHVVEAVAKVVETILATAPKVRVLATSQEPLGILGEHVMRLSPLTVPHAGKLAAADALDSGAVRLFVERARAGDAHFVLDDRSASTLAGICRRLDGIPLAIEMAAARAPLLGIEHLARKLDERFRILTSGRRTALPRQQTLRATLDWSHSLLSESERIVLRRAAIFAGTFTLDAAAGVLRDETIDDVAVIDALAHLVARSLVVTDTNETDTRYRLLETTRAYAAERLDESGERAVLASRHACFYRDLFERAYEESWTLPDTAWRDAYALERDNVRTALEWALGTGGDAECGVALAGASSLLWTYLALVSEERAWLERAVPLVDDVPAPIAARLWHRLGMTYVEAEPKRGLAAFERALALPQGELDLVTRASLFRSYAIGLVLGGRMTDARAALADALALGERTGIPRLISEIITTRASIRLPEGDTQGARSDQEKALELFRNAGADRSALNTLCNLADAHWAAGGLERAITGFREAAARLRQATFVHRDLLGVTLGNLAGALTEHGDFGEARFAAREALPLLREDQTAWLWFDHFALLAAAGGRIDDAARLAGCGDAMLVMHGRIRQPNEMRARHSLELMLAEKLRPDERARLIGDGASLSEDEAYRIVVLDEAVEAVGCSSMRGTTSPARSAGS